MATRIAPTPSGYLHAGHRYNFQVTADLARPRDSHVETYACRCSRSIIGDFVIWRRDDLPAYQLVSVIEDRDLGTTHIVRGEDLLASTAAQIFIAPQLSANNVVAAHYIHHPLMTDASGTKLSKSR